MLIGYARAAPFTTTPMTSSLSVTSSRTFDPGMKGAFRIASKRRTTRIGLNSRTSPAIAESSCC